MAPYKPEVWDCAKTLCQALHAAERQVLLASPIERVPKTMDTSHCDVVELSQLAHAHMIITLGGDGTLLAVAHHAAPCGVPLLGIDLGSFGFLAEEPFEVLMSELDSVLAGEYETEQRLMVAVEVTREGDVVSQYCGLNDAVIAKTDVRHLVRLYTCINGEHIATYPADGLIVSTPTGSTAYTLSAGGPIISPAVECLVITPICPHTLYSRPLVVESSATIEVSATSRGKPVLGLTLTIDGQEAIELQPGDHVLLRRAEFCAQLVRISTGGFYQRLRTKLNWGTER